VALFGGEDVGAFDVTVHHALRVQVVQPLQNLLDVDRDEALGEGSKLLDRVRQRSVFDVLEDDVEVFFGLDACDVFDNVGMVESIEQIDFADHARELLLRDAAQQDLLDSDDISSVHLERLVDHAVAAFADHISELVDFVDSGARRVAKRQRVQLPALGRRLCQRHIKERCLEVALGYVSFNLLDSISYAARKQFAFPAHSANAGIVCRNDETSCLLRKLQNGMPDGDMERSCGFGTERRRLLPAQG